jgi:hypothetical protein
MNDANLNKVEPLPVSEEAVANPNSKLETRNPEPAPPLFPQAKGESDRAFEAFRVYLELGPRRRFFAVARKVGSSLRTIQRWAALFDWRTRIKTYAAGSAEHYIETEQAVHREEFLDAAARDKSFRDRQYALAEALLDAAELYIERMEEADLDQMSLADACKALEVASRLGQQAAARQTDDPSEDARHLRDQITALLDQAYSEVQPPSGAASQVQSPQPHQTHA